jgi:molecular chaperone HscB
MNIPAPIELPAHGPTCWRCDAPLAQAVRCPACAVIQPPDPTATAFARLGLPEVFEQPDGAIERARRAHLVAVHPDRFVRAEPVERALALAHATAINDAARVLLDRHDRLKYLIAQRVPDLGPSRLDDGDWQQLLELKLCLVELRGADGHVERSRLIRRVAQDYEAGLMALGIALDEGSQPVETLAPIVGRLRALRSILEADGE